jgi:serine/threonine-protein kinase
MEVNVPSGVRPGDVLADKYRVERVLGRGGMGVVVAAHHIQLDERVALKFLLPEALGHPEAVARFVREARAAVKIKGEHVARVSDVGTLPDGAPYIVMEYLEGRDLAQWLEERGPLGLEQAVEFTLQACVAVAEAHGLGIVHRDLKPANLFCVLRADGVPSIKVLDFGISKMLDTAPASDPSAMSITKTANAVGSPFYMSPEQVQRARDVDTRTDIWALGVILFELLTGKTPFMGEAFGERPLKNANETPPSLRAYRPELPAALDPVVLRCLEKDRARRYPDVAELAVALEPFAPPRARAIVERITNIVKRGHSAPPPDPMAFVGSGPGTVAIQGSGAAWSGPPRVPGATTKKLVALVAAVVVLLAGGAAALIVSPSSKPAPSGGTTAMPPTASVAAPSSAASSSAAATSTVTAESAPPHLPEELAAASVVLPAPKPSTSAHASHTPAIKPVAGHGSPAPPTAPGSHLATPGGQCDPPYTLDEQGRKKFKAECFLTPTP